MKPLPLTETNPYFKDPEKMEKLVSRSVETSCGVEGIKSSRTKKIFNIPRRGKKRIYEEIK